MHGAAPRRRVAGEAAALKRAVRHLSPHADVDDLDPAPRTGQDPRPKDLGLAPLRCDAYPFVIAKPVMTASTLWVKRMPYTPSVDCSFPAPTSCALS